MLDLTFYETTFFLYKSGMIIVILNNDIIIH